MPVRRPWTKEVVTDARVEVWAPSAYARFRSVEEDAVNLAHDVNALFKEHVEWQEADAHVVKVTEIQCSFCKTEYEEDAVGPVCCDAAIAAFIQHQKEVAAKSLNTSGALV